MTHITLSNGMVLKTEMEPTRAVAQVIGIELSIELGVEVPS